MSNLVSQAEFARQAGYARSYVTQLKQSGRLVMDGKRVIVDQSLARIAATKDPNRDDVQARHAKARKNTLEDERMDNTGDSFQSARATKEKYLALQAKADYEKSIGQLVEYADVKRAGAEIGITVRTALENMPDQLSAELAPIHDQEQIHALLVEQVEDLLHKLSDKLNALQDDPAS